MCALQNQASERKQYQGKIKHAFKKAGQDFQQNFGNYVQYKEVKKELLPPTCQALDSVTKCKKEYTQASQRHYGAQRVFQNKIWKDKNKQPVIDSERQLSGRLLDSEVKGVLERTRYMTLQHMILIDTILTAPGSTVEKEYYQQFAFSALEILECQKISELKTTIPLDPLPVTLSTSMSCHIQKICRLDTVSARRSWRARQHY
ncbi:hypothetical protein BDV09DRAFT_190204 [Aspergillus tetrazonus]